MGGIVAGKGRSIAVHINNSRTILGGRWALVIRIMLGSADGASIFTAGEILKRRKSRNLIQSEAVAEWAMIRITTPKRTSHGRVERRSVGRVMIVAAVVVGMAGRGHID